MATIANLGEMLPTALTPSRAIGGGGTGGGTSAGGDGGSNAQEGLGQINNGASAVSRALGTAQNALGAGGGAGLAMNNDLTQPSTSSFKKGGKVNSKGRDWHGFGGGKTGKNNHGF
jgi:hypothetical protein